MPLRLVRMYRFILGFQRRVWCPKWTPESSSCFMVTTAMAGKHLLLPRLSRLTCWSAALVPVPAPEPGVVDRDRGASLPGYLNPGCAQAREVVPRCRGSRVKCTPYLRQTENRRGPGTASCP